MNALIVLFEMNFMTALCTKKNDEVLKIGKGNPV